MDSTGLALKLNRLFVISPIEVVYFASRNLFLAGIQTNILIEEKYKDTFTKW
jgi:hypothetical protein